MKHVPFTRDLGQKLMNEGFSNFVLSHHRGEEQFYNPEAVLTLEPTTESTKGKVLPIKQLNNLHEDNLQRVYVRLED